ncbi:MAG: hypothetical protein WC880_00435 [Candidatus Paceibacterota bacterium]
MKRTWTYNALTLMAVALVASSGTVAFAETDARPLPKIPSAKTYLDNLGNNPKTEPRAGFIDPVRPTGGRPAVPAPGVRRAEEARDRMGSTTREGVRPGIASTTRPGHMSTTTRERNEQRIKEEMKRLAERLLAVIHRLEELIVRIESRATKIDQAGGNTVSARADIAIAKTEIASAKQDLSTIQAAAVSILNASNMAAVSASLAPIRTTTDNAQMHIKKAREAIESAVKKLGVAARAIHKNATTTPRT